ncbi:hypothetical protein B0H67DRAFT_601620 [Lasiosphaeris hirsuta]|uniref:N-acetyltransferase domain-containing protein n=1 Tax=Lasiosphaeris hirsuta TaxID=260670 RepID=A0AA40DRJ5_9PEZI|nr:hypothetical protein B0H67DRAFT_601620 [Lasiosphaeris hirsuta]
MAEDTASNWTITGCTVDDAPALGTNNAGAFWGQPYWRMIWPDDAQLSYITEQMQKRIATHVLLFDRHKRRHEKAVDKKTGALLGYARWLLPPALQSDGPETAWPEAMVPDVDEEAKKKFQALADTADWKPGEHTPGVNTEELDAKISAVQNRLRAEREYMILDYVAVHPDNQGRGVASSLARRGIQQAERLGVPIFVLAFDVSLGVYLREGFREVERLLQDARPCGGNENYNTYFLVYEPESLKTA